MSNGEPIDLCASDTEEDEPLEELIASRFFGQDDDDATEAEDEEEESPVRSPGPSSAGGVPTAAGPSSAGGGPTAAGPSAAGGGPTFFSSLLEENGGLVRTDRPFDPMAHQCDAAIFCSSRPSIYALVHEPGLGKTCTTMLIFAALERRAQQEGRSVGRLLISSPAAVALHWRRTVLDYLAICPREVLLTSKADEVTAAALKDARVIILTRDCLTNIFRKCHTWVEEHHTIPMPNGTGRRWVGGWATRGSTPLFTCLEAEGLELMSIDEAHVLRNPKTAWCEAHHRVARAARMRGICTGTPICVRPSPFKPARAHPSVYVCMHMAHTWHTWHTCIHMAYMAYIHTWHTYMASRGAEFSSGRCGADVRSQRGAWARQREGLAAEWAEGHCVDGDG